MKGGTPMAKQKPTKAARDNRANQKNPNNLGAARDNRANQKNPNNRAHSRNRRWTLEWPIRIKPRFGLIARGGAGLIQEEVDRKSEIWIAAWFFGTIILAIGAVVFEPMRKLFVIYIAALSVCLVLPMAGMFVIPACLIRGIIAGVKRKRAE